MAQDSHVVAKLVDAAMELAAVRGWHTLSLAGIAKEAGVPLADAYDACPTKLAILTAAFADADRQVLAGPDVESDEPAKDRLFDVIMRRFDAVAPRKEGIRAILRGLPRDPASLACALPSVARSMAWMLEAAGLSSAGVAGSIRIKVLGAVYLSTLRDWLEDDTADLARTMAALDRRLRRVDDFMPGWEVPCPPPLRTRRTRRRSDDSPPAGDMSASASV